MTIVVINGPNINLLGIREPAIYGERSYETLLAMLRDHAARHGVELECFQSNHEGALVDRLQQAYFDGADGIILNPAAYTHTSIAIADALKAIRIPTVEVHISRVEERESFRQTDYIREAAASYISGEGLEGYLHAMDLLIRDGEARRDD